MNEPPIIPENVPPRSPAPPPQPQQIIYYVQQPAQGGGFGSVIRTLFAIFIIGAVLIGCIGAFIAADRASSIPPQPYVPSQKERALQKVGIKQWSWKRENEAFMTATFTITNGSVYDIKDVEIKCVHCANSGTVIDNNTRTIYEVIPAGQVRTFENFDMGFIHSQATSSSAEIKDFDLVEK